MLAVYMIFRGLYFIYKLENFMVRCSMDWKFFYGYIIIFIIVVQILS